MKAIIKYVYNLPSNKKNVPELITDPIMLLKDVRALIESHCRDDPELAITGKPVLPPQVRLLVIVMDFRHLPMLSHSNACIFARAAFQAKAHPPPAAAADQAGRRHEPPQSEGAPF